MPAFLMHSRPNSGEQEFMTGQDKPSEHSQTFEANNETSEVPALTLADYVAFCKQGDAQLLACCEVETFHATGPGG